MFLSEFIAYEHKQFLFCEKKYVYISCKICEIYFKKCIIERHFSANCETCGTGVTWLVTVGCGEGDSGCQEV